MIRKLKAADAVGTRVGKCAFHVAEDLALKGALRHAPVLTATSERCARDESAWIVCATTSLQPAGR